jgi:hypothetical protein
MMLTAEFLDQRYPHFRVALELGGFVGIYDVLQIAGNHLNSLSVGLVTPIFSGG